MRVIAALHENISNKKGHLSNVASESVHIEIGNDWNEPEQNFRAVSGDLPDTA